MRPFLFLIMVMILACSDQKHVLERQVELRENLRYTFMSDTSYRFIKGVLSVSDSMEVRIAREKGYRASFLQKKYRLYMLYMAKCNVSTLEDLPLQEMVNLGEDIYALYKRDIIQNNPSYRKHAHVRDFYSKDAKTVNMIATCFVNSLRYRMSASVALAQTGVETSYGRNIKGNN